MTSNMKNYPVNSIVVAINNCDNKSSPYSFAGYFQFRKYEKLSTLILDCISFMYSFKTISFVNQEGKRQFVLPFWFSHTGIMSHIDWKNVVSHNFKLFANVHVLTFLTSLLNLPASPSLTSRSRLSLVGFYTSYRHMDVAWQTRGKKITDL
jgi:hypothetical protein